MTTTITLYYNPTQRQLHVLTCVVNPTSGAHKVTDSKLEGVSAEFKLASAIDFYARKVGDPNVRAYETRESN
jgi:hypothetical protein